MPDNDASAKLPNPCALPSRCDLELAQVLYALDGVDHPFCKRWSPEVIGRGGEHVVYRSRVEPSVVLKVNIDLLERSVRSPGGETEKETRRYAETTGARVAAMSRHFSGCTVPDLKLECLEVPVTPGMLLWQFRDAIPEAPPRSVLASVAFQEYVPALLLDGALSITSGYAEKRIHDLEILTNTNRLLLDREAPTEEASEAFRTGQMEKDVCKLLDKATTDPELRAVLESFVAETCSYCDATDETLDLAGSGNVSVSQLDGRWRCFLPDALYPGRERMLAKTREVVSKAVGGHEIDGGDANILMNGLNFVRTVNGLAHVLGMPQRLAVAPRGTKLGETNLVRRILETQLGERS